MPTQSHTEAAVSHAPNSHAAAARSEMTDGPASVVRPSLAKMPIINAANFVTGTGGGALRPIDEKFAVNPFSGTLSLTFPLPITAGRGGLQPSLSLMYNSGGGNGPLGIGWSIPFDSIQRKTSRGVPTYDEKDVYIISSAEDLVSVDEEPEQIPNMHGDYMVRVYRPRVEEEVALIEKLTNTKDPGDVYWRIISSSNVTRVFGRTDQSRVYESEIPSRKRIFSWLLCEAYDTNGNAIVYSYKSEDAKGLNEQVVFEAGRSQMARSRTKYIKSIKYGNQRVCRDLETWSILPWKNIVSEMKWSFEVIFDYGEHSTDCPTVVEELPWKVRRDVFSTYKSGFEIRTARLCRRVLMFHHLPERLNAAVDCLVSSTCFEYDEMPGATFLKCFVQNGHIQNGNGGYHTQSLAPFIFDYCHLPDPSSLEIKSTRPTCLQNVLAATSSTVTQWIDLESDGLTGLLVQQDGSWYYQRNENAVNVGLDHGESESDSDSEPEVEVANSFGTIKELRTVPNPRSPASTAAFEDLEADGSQNLVLFDDSGRPDSYYTRLPNGEWAMSQAFESVPNINLNTKHVRRIDLTGNGQSDVLLVDNASGQIIWYESLGKKGFGPETRRQAPAGTGRLPRLLADDGQRATYLMDMSGDGLSDIVQVANGCVSYWPNMGYGRFGGEVVMGNSPHLDSDDLFNLKRIHFMDMDGSGTADLVYMPPSGGVVVHFNYCGNTFSDGIVIPCFPRMHNLVDIFVADILGNGTSCLCWAGPDGSINNDPTIFYLDITAGRKPHLLKSYTNGGGLTTSVSYQPSTKFYLRDEHEGWHWKTKLPFPIHVVSKVVERDEIALTTHTKRYRYHEGHYDRHDREFRGFGIAEQWQTEAYFSNGWAKKPYKKPTLYSKLWFFTGSLEAGLLPAHAFGSPHLLSALNSNDSAWGHLDAFRALKGKPLRTETYGRDGSACDDVPYTIHEHSYEVKALQATKGAKQPGIHRILQREALVATYERSKEEPPRLQHELVLEHNSYGDVTKRLTVRYGRDSSTLSDVNARAVQQTHRIRYHETQFTNDWCEQDIFYKPQVAATREYQIFGLAVDGVFHLDSLQKDDYAVIRTATLKDGNGPIPRLLNDMPSAESSPTRVRAGETRVYYQSRDLTQPLDLGKFEPFSIVHQTFKLALTSEHLNLAYGTDDEKLCGHKLKSIMPMTGYANLDGNTAYWWTPSPRSRFSHSTDDGGELAAARRSFYTPIISVDSFDNEVTVKMDNIWLLPQESLDAAGNVTRIVYDYHHMRPIASVDPNGNRVVALVDNFGNHTAVATMGKLGEDIGDSLEGMHSFAPDKSELTSLMQHMTLSAASKLLGSASSRAISCHERLKIADAASGEVVLPRFQLNVARTRRHWAESRTEQDNADEVLVRITYFDGRGNPLQELNVSDWNSSQPRWAVSRLAIIDPQGNLVKAYRSFYATNHLPISHADLNSPASWIFRDSLGREVGILNADHSWSKTVFHPWSVIAVDAGSVGNVSDPALDPELGYHFTRLSTEQFIPSWIERKDKGSLRERDAAQKSRLYANNSRTSYKDTNNRIILTEQIGGSKKRHQTISYDIHGNGITATDALERCLQINQYDMLGNCIATASMDAGWIVTLYDCNGEELLSCNQRGIATRSAYDCLRRKVETRIRDRHHSDEYLWAQTVYGEQLEKAEAANLRGRVAEVRDQSGIRRNVRFDFKGNCVTSTTQLAVEYKSSLDWSQRPAPLLEAEVYSIKTQFDALNRASLSTDALGRTTKREYDLLGGIKRVRSANLPDDRETVQDGAWECHIAGISYNAEARPLKIQWGNKVTTSFTYDAETGYATNKRSQRASDGAVLEDITYTYDILGQTSHSTDAAQQTLFFRNAVVEPSREYWYDALGRLIKATGRETIATTGNGSQSAQQNQPSNQDATRGVAGDGRQLARYTETYEYDDVDNPLSTSHESAGVKTAGWKRTYHYEEASLLLPEQVNNRLSHAVLGKSLELYGYDNDAGITGCLTQMPSYSRLEWDCNSKLQCSARQYQASGDPETTWYVYDSDGTRVRKVTERARSENDVQRGEAAVMSTIVRKLKETLYLGSAEVHRKYDGVGVDITFEKTTSLITHGGTDIPGLQGPLTLIETDIAGGEDPTALARYSLSQSLEVDDQGRLVSYEEYSPWGCSVLVICRSDIEAPSSYRYASYRRDSETGLYHCGARYYAPWLGRWTSPDPLGMVDGPNVYTYCNSDPVNWTDATGTMMKKSDMTNSLLKNGDSAGQTDAQLGGRRNGTKGGHQLLLEGGTRRYAEVIVDSLELQEKIAKGDILKQAGTLLKEKAAITAVKVGITVSTSVVPGLSLLGKALNMGLDKADEYFKNKKGADAEREARVSLVERGAEQLIYIGADGVGQKVQDVVTKYPNMAPEVREKLIEIVNSIKAPLLEEEEKNKMDNKVDEGYDSGPETLMKSLSELDSDYEDINKDNSKSELLVNDIGDNESLFKL